MTAIRLGFLALAALLTASAAQAQAISPLTGATELTAPRRTHHATMAERFDKANTTHDGRLTRAQAWAGHMNAVGRDFAAIDTGHKGYVTMDDIRAHAKARRTSRHLTEPTE